MAYLNKSLTGLDECFNIRENTNSTKQSEYRLLPSASVDQAIGKEESEMKVLYLRHLLEKDLKAADFKWSLFIAACHTYRLDTCLKPFPPMYIKNEIKDIDGLRKAIEYIPPLSIVAQELKEPNVYDTKGSSIELLFWVLVKLRDMRIKTVNKDCHESVLKRVNSELTVAAPNLIFQVASSKLISAEQRWRQLAKGHNTFYAYHGSRLENFHSIIHYGLQQHLCKESLFGKGIYLSSELAVSLPYSPVGYGWGGSLLGSDMSCVALCEVINHPDVKLGDTNNSARNLAPESIGGKVPNKYCIVLNNDLVRIRYLLVYSQEFGCLRSSHTTGFLGWLKQHKLLTFMLGYVVLLASIGLSQNRNVERYFRLLINKFGLD
ncbi:PREDICTED: mono [ADP-ribose] polymerase PARP16 [Ceratosolen solmsi marchali]|uniref:Poly [ADP-ribose] polymerase n=1 Tax=Ceratosolen solmsi marchali TaxID=326594 RepID=A0AAJ6VKZ0_9HYME|nr:PREDICTED: mono [ADP-ribose] polymerase PARP16 [Ceratosolen solmsi marchali]